MTRRIDVNKWILYRHTRSFDLICAVAEYLKSYSQASISDEDKYKLIIKLKELGFYNERNPEIPLDSINHRINTLAYFMFGYKDKINGNQKFLFSPLGNLFLKHINDVENRTKIFFTMLWGVQFPHPHGGTDDSFNVYPFRLLFRLMTDERLQKKIYAYEVAYLVVFIQSIDIDGYDMLVEKMLRLREESNETIESKFMKDVHLYVNATYEWDYYLSELFQSAGVVKKTDGRVICRLQHGNTKTFRNVTRNVVEINETLLQYCELLLELYPYTAKPLRLDDPERLKIDVVKEIYSFYPEVLSVEIGEIDAALLDILNLPRLIEQYSYNNEGEEAIAFEKILVDGFNLFHNVVAKWIGGAGNTDIECLYLTKNSKFAVDAKSTKNKLSSLNAARLEGHKDKIGGLYTIVITPRYVPAVIRDIKSANIVIILANTLSEYLYNCINNDIREIDYGEFDDIIIKNLGKDISPSISRLTFEKFGVGKDT
jgi:hypothetical protein